MQAEWNLLPFEKKRQKIDDDEEMRAVVVYEEKEVFAAEEEIKENEDSNNGIMQFMRTLPAVFRRSFQTEPGKYQLSRILQSLPSKVFVVFTVVSKPTEQKRKIGNILYAKGFPRLVKTKGQVGCLVQIENPDEFTIELFKNQLAPHVKVPNTFFFGGFGRSIAWYQTSRTEDDGVVDMECNFFHLSKGDISIDDD